MPAGFFTQGFTILLNDAVALEAIETLLGYEKFQVHRRESMSTPGAGLAPALLVPYRPDDRGFAIIDVVPACWPDAMGNPGSDPETFAAWSMGFYGPFTYPGCLYRSQQHCHLDQGCRNAQQNHVGFVRVLLSYAIHAKPTDLVFPTDRQPTTELSFMMQLASSLLKLPEALCYFNPNGEVLCGVDDFTRILVGAKSQNLQPLPLYSNVRARAYGDLTLMDTVGNDQFDVADVEALFPNEAYELDQLEDYLRSRTVYLMSLGRESQTGEQINGPVDNNFSWTVSTSDKASELPPRRVVRVYPTPLHARITEMLERM